MAERIGVHLCYSQFACNICGLITNISIPNQYISINKHFHSQTDGLSRVVDRLSIKMPILDFMGS